MGPSLAKSSEGYGQPCQTQGQPQHSGLAFMQEWQAEQEGERGVWGNQERLFTERCHVNFKEETQHRKRQNPRLGTQSSAEEGPGPVTSSHCLCKRLTGMTAPASQVAKTPGVNPGEAQGQHLALVQLCLEMSLSDKMGMRRLVGQAG